MTRVLRTLLSGLLVLLPVFITIVLVVWLGTFLFHYVGPSGIIGQMLIGIGLGLFAGSPFTAYLIGAAFLALLIYLVGIIVESKLSQHFNNLVDWVMRQVPLVSNVYDLTKRLVALVDRKDPEGLRGMSPVWCHFGGDSGAVVLALLPSSDPVMLDGRSYHAILVPSAPLPVGGALVYVPVEWIKPANVGLENLISVYVSMGVTAPNLAPPKLPRTAERAASERMAGE